MDAEETRTRWVVEQYVAAYASGDASRVDEIVAPTFVDHSFPAFSGGPEGVARGIRAVHAGFSDIRCSLEQCVPGADSVAFRVAVAGRHTGTFGGHPPTGRRVSWSAADFARLAEGKLVELWSTQDSMALLEGIGAASRVRPSALHDFPAFMQTPANRIAAGSQYTQGIEGYLFDGADGSQVAFWKSPADRVSKEHAHDFDEYVLVVEGRVTAIIAGDEVELRAGQEMVIPKGTIQSMAVAAGTRTIHVFGGKRANRG